MGEFGGRVWNHLHLESNSQTGMENPGSMVRSLFRKLIVTEYLNSKNNIMDKNF